MQKGLQMIYVVQNKLQSLLQNTAQPQRGDLFIGVDAEIFPVAPAERPLQIVYRSLRRSYKNRGLAVSYRQVAPLELKHHAVTRAVIRAERRADEYAELGAVGCAVIRADARAVVYAERYAEKWFEAAIAHCEKAAVRKVEWKYSI